MDEKELNSHRTNTYKSDSMLNRMIISQETNNQVISDSAPSEYLQSLVDNGLHVNTLKDRLSRAYVNEQAYNHLMEDNYHGFIQTRCQHLLQVINGMASMNLLEFIEADPDENEEPAQNEANLEEQTIEFIGQLGDEASE